MKVLSLIAAAFVVSAAADQDDFVFAELVETLMDSNAPVAAPAAAPVAAPAAAPKAAAPKAAAAPKKAAPKAAAPKKAATPKAEAKAKEATKKDKKKIEGKIAAAKQAEKKQANKGKAAVNESKVAAARVADLKKKLTKAESELKTTSKKAAVITKKVLASKAKGEKAKSQLKGLAPKCPETPGEKRTKCLKDLRVKVRADATDASRNATVKVIATTESIKDDVIASSETSHEVRRACEDTPTSAKCLAAQKKYRENLTKIKTDIEKSIGVITTAVQKSDSSKESIVKINAKVTASKVGTPKPAAAAPPAPPAKF